MTRGKWGIHYRALLTGTALCTVLAAQAWGQSATSIKLDEIVITGQTLADKRAIAAKRDSTHVQDSVAGDEISKLPDFNAGDAVKRVAGVNVVTYQGEPRYVTIRGLGADYNTTLIDGFHVASPDVEGGGRRIYMEVLPSNFVSRIDVTKTGSADTDGQAIGGVINFVTPSAFNFDKNVLTISGEAGAYLQSGAVGGATPTGQTDVFAARRFGKDNQFGIALGGSFWRRDIEVPQIESGGQWYWYGDDGKVALPYGGNGIGVPGERRWYVYDNSRQRQGGNAKFDWQASDNVKTTFGAYYFNQTERSDRNENTFTNPGTTVVDQTATSGTINGSQTVQLGQLRFDRSMYGVNNTTEFTPVDKLQVETKIGWSGASLSNPQTWDQFKQNNLPVSYSTAGSIPVVTPLSASYSDPSSYALVNHRYETQDLRTNLYEGQLNVAYNLAPEDRGFGVKVGTSAMRTYRDLVTSRTIYSGMPYSLADVQSSRTLCSFGCSTGQFFTIDPGRASAALANNMNAAQISSDLAYANAGTYSLQEGVITGYGLVQFAADRWRAQAGLRYEATNFSSQGTKAVDTVYVPTSNTNNYANLLPSASVSYDLTPDLKTRFAYSRTLGRPKYTDLADHGGTLVTTGSQPILQQSNPNLRPRVSDNFDLSEEYYFDDGKGMASVALFAKNIKNEIFTYGIQQNLPGIDQPVLVTQAQNSSAPVKVQGIEFNLIKNFTFLPDPFDGFGLIANGTLLHTSFPITLADGSTIQALGLPQQAEKMFNLILFYEKGPWHGRIGWNYTGRLWDDRFSNLTSASQFYRNRYQAPFAQINIQVGYDVNEHLKITANAFNVTGAGLRDTIGDNLELTQAYIGFAPAVMAGATYTW